MKRAAAALLALVLALGCVWGSGRYFRGQLEGDLRRQLIYDTSLEKNYSPNAFPPFGTRAVCWCWARRN